MQRTKKTRSQGRENILNFGLFPRDIIINKGTLSGTPPQPPPSRPARASASIIPSLVPSLWFLLHHSLPLLSERSEHGVCLVSVMVIDLIFSFDAPTYSYLKPYLPAFHFTCEEFGVKDMQHGSPLSQILVSNRYASSANLFFVPY